MLTNTSLVCERNSIQTLHIKRVGIYMAADGYLDKVPASLASFGQGHEAFHTSTLLLVSRLPLPTLPITVV